MNKTQQDLLIRRDVELTLHEETKAWDAKIYFDAHEALIELHLVVNKAKTEGSRTKYLKCINDIRLFMDRNDKIKADLDRLTVEYNRLYARYAHQVELNRNLQKDFEKSETT